MTKCTYGESARMTWPKALWIEGSGRYASVSFCAPGPAVVLCRTHAAAKALKRQIDVTGCGGQCTGKHAIFEVGPPRVTFVRDYITADLPRRADGRIGPLLPRLRARWRRNQRASPGRTARRPA